MSAKKMLLIGALLGALAVTCGALGAHFLYRIVGGAILLPEVWQRKQENWETASRYLMYHALAIVACGLLAHLRPSRSLNVAFWFFLLGTLTFCGCLYAIVLTGITRPLGMIVPIGGVLMICGWLSLAYAGGGYCTAECDLRKQDG